MFDSDLFDDLELEPLPNCREPMQPAGSSPELPIEDATVVIGSAQ